MPHNRFFLDAPLNSDEEVLLSGDEAHHLQRVMRKEEDDSVELVNGRNDLAVAKILSFEKKGIRLQITACEKKIPVDFLVILCQAIPRLNRLEMIVEKGVELGMSELWLFPGQLSEKKELSASQLQRLNMIAIAAMKQCGRLDLPKIALMPPLLKWEPPNDPCYFGDTTKEAPPFLSVFQKKEKALFFNGPESGFSEQEERHLRHFNAIGINLHPNILRTETAPLAFLTLISAALVGHK